MKMLKTFGKRIGMGFILLLTINVWMAQLPVDHKLNVQFVKPADESFEVQHISCMYAGLIEKDFLQMERIFDYQDGEIVFEISSFNVDNPGINNEDIFVGLTNEDNPNEYFRFHLINNTLILEDFYNNVTRAISLQSYQNGDEIRVVRCQQKILYYINDYLIDVVHLLNNDFEMFGEVDVQTTSSVPFNAYIEFHPL